MAFEPWDNVRYKIRAEPGDEVVIIPAPRSVPYICFLALWLLGWVGAGISTIMRLADDFSPGIAIWLLIWIVGGGYLASTFLWMLKGRQELRCVDGDLEVSDCFPGCRLRKRYRAANIRDLSVAALSGLFDWWEPRRRFNFMGGAVAVAFTYGQRICRIAPGVEVAEATAIVAWLRKRLPSA